MVHKKTRVSRKNMSFERLLQFDGKRVDLDLSATLILREIDFGHFETLKNHFEDSKFDFGKVSALKNVLVRKI